MSAPANSGAGKTNSVPVSGSGLPRSLPASDRIKSNSVPASLEVHQDNIRLLEHKPIYLTGLPCPAKKSFKWT